MLHATRLEVSLSQRPILRDVEFRARPGQLTAIVGPNGSGKTTLLRLIAGELQPDDGAIVLPPRWRWVKPPRRTSASRSSV